VLSTDFDFFALYRTVRQRFERLCIVTDDLHGCGSYEAKNCRSKAEKIVVVVFLYGSRENIFLFQAMVRIIGLTVADGRPRLQDLGRSSSKEN